MYEIIDGKKVSAFIKDDIKERVIEYKTRYGKDIFLAVVLVGEDPASKVYVKNKMKACEYVGIVSETYVLPEESPEEEVAALVKKLAGDNSVDGILVQLPLPKHINQERILRLIPDEKDADGFSDANIGRLFQNKKSVVSCTPAGIMELLKFYKINPAGKRAVIIGRSNIVGKPMAALLLNAHSTITVCHSKTVNLKEVTKDADILVVAIGKPEFVTADMVKENAVVIDVGINRVNGQLVGDVDFEAVKEKASYITPVPGGVGPMTIAMLMSNTYYLAAARAEKTE